MSDKLKEYINSKTYFDTKYSSLQKAISMTIINSNIIIKRF